MSEDPGTPCDLQTPRNPLSLNRQYSASFVRDDEKLGKWPGPDPGE